MTPTRPLWLIRALCLPILFACTCIGCASKLPKYPAMGGEEAALIIADRLESVRTISARCEITMIDPQSQTVRLDGALAAAPPDRLRLRAWKFNRPVFDLTLTPEALWLFTAEDAADSHESQFSPVNFSAGQIGDAWKLFTNGFFTGRPTLDSSKSNGSEMQFTSTKANGMHIRCVVDRRTLTPTTYEIQGLDGVELFSVRLSRYAAIQGISWPTKVEFQSRDGVVSLRLNDLEVNAVLAEAAFVPPRRAVKQP